MNTLQNFIQTIGFNSSRKSFKVTNPFAGMIATVKTESPTAFKHITFYLVLAFIAVIGLIVDDRQLAGVSVWLKPFKFMLSGAIYLFTVSYLTTLYPFSERKKRIVIAVNTWAMTLDLLIVFVQGARGVRSHYNIESLVDGIIFGAMGILVSITVVFMVFFLFETIRLKMKVAKPVQWSILLAWIIVLVGSYVGGQMIGQMSHTVGANDGGSGMALTNWSDIAGDLRVAHFFGLHAIQLLPLFALFLHRKWKTSTLNQILLVSVFAAMYAFWVFYTFYQAKQGLPLMG